MSEMTVTPGQRYYRDHHILQIKYHDFIKSSPEWLVSIVTSYLLKLSSQQKAYIYVEIKQTP